MSRDNLPASCSALILKCSATLDQNFKAGCRAFLRDSPQIVMPPHRTSDLAQPPETTDAPQAILQVRQALPVALPE